MKVIQSDSQDGLTSGKVINEDFGSISLLERPTVDYYNITYYLDFSLVLEGQ